jgi:hypothetical protein
MAAFAHHKRPRRHTLTRRTASCRTDARSISTRCRMLAGVTVKFLSLGGCITEIDVPDRRGQAAHRTGPRQPAGLQFKHRLFRRVSSCPDPRLSGAGIQRGVMAPAIGRRESRRRPCATTSPRNRGSEPSPTSHPPGEDMLRNVLPSRTLPTRRGAGFRQLWF